MNNGFNNRIDAYNKYNQEFIEELKDLNDRNSAFVNMLLSEITNGTSTVMAKVIQSNAAFNVDWIDVVEGYIPSLMEIVKDKSSSVIENETNIAAIINSNKKLIPGNYEKRFIKTLINRMYSFINYRYNKMVSVEQDHLNRKIEVDSDFQLNNSNVHYNLKVDIDSANQNFSKVEDAIKRAKRLVEVISEIKVSSFMEKLAKQPEIKERIMKTNVLIKDPDYKNCYLLYLYVDSYVEAVSQTSERMVSVSDDYKDQLLNVLMLSFITIQANSKNREELIVEDDYMENITNTLSELSILEEEQEHNPANFKENMISRYAQAFDEYSATFTDRTSQKKVLRDMTSLVNMTYRYIGEIPNDKEDVFKTILITDEESYRRLVAEYKVKIRMLKDALLIKQADIASLTRSIEKMEGHIARYNEKVKAIKTKEKEAIKKKQDAQKAKERARAKAKREKEKAKAKPKSKTKKSTTKNPINNKKVE